METIKRLARNILIYLPNNGAAVKLAARNLILKKNLALHKVARSFAPDHLPDPRTIYWLDPFRIERCTSLANASPDREDWVFPQDRKVKLVQSGSWDQPDIHVKDLRICRAVEDRIRHGLPWQQSDYYQVALSQIRSGRHVWRCSSQADLDARMEKLDGLIESVGKKGYLQHDSLPELTGHDSPLGHAEVIVNIGRNGEPLFQDGRHRLAIARTLGIREIPVQIYIRHAEWQEFRDFLHRMAYGNMGAAKPGFLYQKPQHFDLADIPAEHDCQDRWEAIRSNLPQARGCALDIGANLGYFSHELDSAGFEATAVEYLPDVAYAAKRLALANGRSINVVQGDILAEDIFGKIGKSDFKVVLAINVFHHFIKTEEGFLRLRAFMKRLRADTLFFEPHHPADPQMQGVYLNPTPEKFAEMIVDWGGFNSSEPIFTAQDGRTIFKLTSAPG